MSLLKTFIAQTILEETPVVASMEETESSTVANDEEAVTAEDTVKEEEKEKEEEEEVVEAKKEAEEDNSLEEKEKNDKDVEDSMEAFGQVLSEISKHAYVTAGLEEFSESIDSVNVIREDITENAIPAGGLTRAEAASVNAAVAVATEPMRSDEAVDVIDPDAVGGTITRMEATEAVVSTLDDYVNKTGEGIAAHLTAMFDKMQDTLASTVQAVTSNVIGSKLDTAEIKLAVAQQQNSPLANEFNLAYGKWEGWSIGKTNYRAVFNLAVSALSELTTQLKVEEQLQVITTSGQSEEIISNEYNACIRRALDSIQNSPVIDMLAIKNSSEVGTASTLEELGVYITEAKGDYAELSSWVSSGELEAVSTGGFEFIARIGNPTQLSSTGAAIARASYIATSLFALSSSLKVLRCSLTYRASTAMVALMSDAEQKELADS